MSEEPVPKIRFYIFRAVILLAFAVLTVQLWRLQVLRGEELQMRADRNRFRLVPIEAPRGIIYDRHDNILARNRPSFTVSIVPADLPPEKANAVFARLSELLEVPVSLAAASTSPGESTTQRGIREMVEAGREAPFRPVHIKGNVPRDIAFVIEEQHLELPGVRVEVEPVRSYPEGALLSHILGFVGPIPQEEADRYYGQGYSSTDRVGRAGVELVNEEVLRGTKGRKHVEVDAAGREMRTVGDVIAAEPGNNLVLSIDLELQQAARQALAEQLKALDSPSGVVAAMNPQTGEVLAMVSLPSYDNNLFAGGISAEAYRRLTQDPNRPLLNRTISGEYPTGSTFKIVPATAALEEGVITPQTEIFGPGTIWLPNRYVPDDPDLAQPFYCWNRSGHGSVNIVEALSVSCDVFFYEIAGGFKGSALFNQDRLREVQGLGAERLHKYTRLFGFGEVTGIDLPGESAGLVGTAEWKREVYGEQWTTGDTYNMGIGQGFFTATPLQLLNAAAAVANGGTLYQPQLVYEVRDAENNVVRPFQPEVIRDIPVSPRNLAIVREGMRAAAEWGTARRAALEGITVAGKTGTAEYYGPRDEEGNLPTHAWFIAFAPYEDPEIALVIFMEGGVNAAYYAAPVASQILRDYYDLPEPVSTPIPIPEEELGE